MDFSPALRITRPANKNDNELLSYCIRNHTEIANLKVTESCGPVVHLTGPSRPFLKEAWFQWLFRF